MQAARKLTAILDWFIPAEYAADEKLFKKVRLWVGIVLITIVYTFFGLAQAIAFDIRAMFTALSIGLAIVSLLPFLLRAGIPFRVVMHISMCNGMANFCFGAYTSGGIFSVVNMWLISVPIIALMLSNLRNALPYIVAVPVILSVFYFLEITGNPPPDFIPKENLPAANLTAITGFALTLFIIVFNYGRANNNLITLFENEKKKSDDLLLNILPYEVAEELKQKGYADAKHFDEVTVLFTDFKDFTAISEKLSPRELVKEIHDCFRAFDDICSKHGVEKIKTIGDAYMAAGGLATVNKSTAVNVVRAGIEIRDFMERKREEKEGNSFEIRIGIHTGPVVAGIVGVKKFAYDIWGDTVNTASRMEGSGEAGKVNISGSTYRAVGSLFNCDYRGKIDVKGKGEIEMYYVLTEKNTLSPAMLSHESFPASRILR